MNETNEHNPDGLTPEQYGAPEWRLLKVGEIPKRGDGISYTISPAKWESIDSDFRCAIGPYAPCTFRRRVSPTLADQSARIAELERRVEELTARLFKLGAMATPPCFVCGYSGPGYFQPDQHPCAAKHHKP